MKRGFTLIELLGVIILISLLMIIILPSIINSIKQSTGDTDKITIDLIYDAASIYISNHKNDFPKIKGNKYVINLKDLIEEEILASEVKLSNGDITNKKCIEVTYEGSYKYELKDSGSCKKAGMCTKVNFETATKYVGDNTKTIGNIPSDGIYNAGDEYICEVGPGINYKFYVLNTAQENAKTVDLIMSHNINSDGSIAYSGITNTGNNIYNLTSWINEEDYLKENGKSSDWGDSGNNNKGPITALNFLKKATSKWTNLDRIIVNTYIDTSGKVYNMKEYKMYARLPYYSEVSMVSSDTKWLINNLYNSASITGLNDIKTITGYWTLSSKPYGAWGIRGDGTLFGVYIYRDSVYGVRPVITVSVDAIN